MLFQFTPPCGRRQRLVTTIYVKINFNSRLHVGGDLPQAPQNQRSSHFNSRLYVGGDMDLTVLPNGEFYFNSRLYVGGDRRLLF